MDNGLSNETINSGFEIFYIFFVVAVVLISLVGIGIVKNMESKVRYSLNYFNPIVQGDPVALYQKVMGIGLIVIAGIALTYRNKSQKPGSL
jgi:hypothetical protein